MSKIKALLFDFDETLFVNEESTRQAVLHAWTTLQSEFPHITPQQALDTYMRVRDEFWKSDDDYLLQVITRSADEARGVLWSKTLDALGIENKEQVAFLVLAFGHKRWETWELYPDAIEILDQLKARYRLIMVTNGIPEIQRGKINKAQVSHYFDPIIISGEIGVSKPNPKYFEIAIKGLDLKADECVVIGDSVQNDVGGAKNAGMTSVWINRGGLLPEPSIEPDYRITALHELLPILEKLG